MRRLPHIVAWTLLLAVLAGPARTSLAAPVQWPDNGHWYDAVLVGSSGITWTQAEAAAQARGGHLASITSATENQFVYSLISNSSFWHASGGGSYVGPWIGGWRPLEAPTDWHWADGEAWGYTHWASGQPNNTNGVETRIHFVGTSAPASGWNDLGDTPVSNWYVKGYVVEWAPEPASAALLMVLGAGVLARRGRRA